MFEGHGGLNPPRYHHRYNMIPGRERGAVPGAIANGMVRDMGLVDRPGFDMSRGGGRAAVVSHQRAVARAQHVLSAGYQRTGEKRECRIAMSPNSCENTVPI